MALIYEFDPNRRRKHSAPPPEPVTGDVLPPAPAPAGVPVVKVRELPPGIRAVPPVIRAYAARAGRWTARQLLRLVHPDTLAAVARCVLRGAGRSLGWYWGWLCGEDIADLRASNPEKFRNIRKGRWPSLLPVSLLVLLVAFNPTAPLTFWLLAALGAIFFLVGFKKGEPLLAPTPDVLGGNESMIREAFVHVKLAREASQVKMASPVVGTANGWTAVVELPPGVASREAVARRDKLAGALGMPAHRLLVTGDEAHAGRVRLRAADRDLLSGEPVANPLVEHPRPVDLWEPLAIGVDVAGQVVSVELVYAGLLVGGMPRRGKSVLCANVLVGALLDPHAQLWMIDGKGLDSRPLKDHAAHLVGHDMDEFAELMETLEREMDKRYDRLARLELDKLTRKVCHAEMPLILLSIDELARYTGSKEKAAKRGIETLRNIVSVGPAAGIIPLLATQKPSSKIVPTDIRDLIPIRAAVACATRAQSNTILGDEATVSAVDLPRDTPGAAWLVHETNTMFRPYLVDGAALRAVAGSVERRTVVTAVRSGSYLATVLDAMRGEAKVTSAELASRLGMTTDDLAAMLRPHGISPKQLGRIGGKSNARGYRLADFQGR